MAAYDRSTETDRRDGPTDRRVRERAPSSDRRDLIGDPPLIGSAADAVEFRPPVTGAADAPPTENTQLLFERS